MIIAPTGAWSSPLADVFLLEPQHVSDSYVAWLNDPEVNRYLESRFERHTLDSTRAFVENCLRNEKTLMLGIRSPRLGGRHVGNIKVEINPRHGLGEVGILIGEKEVYGQGVGTQAIRLMSGIARDQLGLRRLTAGCYASNAGSERAFTKAGYVVEGVRPGHFLFEGRPENLVLMGLHL